MNSLKRTRTNPILPTYVVGKFALSLSKGLLKTLTSSAGKIALPALGCRYRGSEACGQRSRTVEGPVAINLSRLSAIAFLSGVALAKIEATVEAQSRDLILLRTTLAKGRRETLVFGQELH
jgi:hypothetical protein